MECGDKSPLSKAVPRHRTPKNGVFRGRCPPLNPLGEGRKPLLGGLRGEGEAKRFSTTF